MSFPRRARHALLLTTLTLAGCRAHEVATAGVVTMGVGALSAGMGVCLSTGVCLDEKGELLVPDDPATPEVETGGRESPPGAGVVMIAGGLAVMVVGGAMMGAADSAARKKPATPPPMTQGSGSTFRGRRWP